MRKDLNKLLCERERPGSHRNFGERRHDKSFVGFRDQEEVSDLPSRESMKYRYRGNGKVFNENLNPLWGLVRKNAGRPWNKVYSELCKVFDMSSVINQHILLHLKQFVELNCYVGDDGEIYVRAEYGGADKNIRTGYVEYFVHPVTGILTRNKHYKSFKQINRELAKKRERERESLVKVIKKNELELRRRDTKSLWFLCELSPVPRSRTTRVVIAGKIVEKEEEADAYDLWDHDHVVRKTNRFYPGRYRYYGQTARDFYVSKISSAPGKLIKRYT